MRYSLPILLVGLLLGGCDASSPEGGNDDRNEDESTSDLTVTAQWSETHQTIRGFGASDAWTVQSLGDWPADKKNRMADLLFSQETDANEDPKGIGLSIWRFNIGAGSAEQGQASGIDTPQRRVEGFLETIRDDGTLVFDWSKQREERRFLQRAAERGVSTVVGFANSPPVEMTENGKAFGDGSGTSNLADDHYDDYAQFLAAVADHFRTEEVPFDYVSPVNEPQWNWDGGQEGSPYTNDEIRRLVEELSEVFSNRGLSAQVEVPEAGAIDFLYSGSTGRSQRDDQIAYFFGEHSLQELPNVAAKVGGHSYWTTWPVSELLNKRQSLADKVAAVDSSLEYWQTEWLPLEDNSDSGGIQGPGRDLGMEPALYMARVIHVDLTVANASSWQWWRGATGGDYKDGLVYLNRGSQEVLESKLLWGLGNYSRFLRPGAVRVGVGRSDDATLEQRLERGVLASAYRGRDGDRVIVVAVNQGNTETTLQLKTQDTPVPVQTWQPYVTRESSVPGLDRDLEPVSEVEPGGVFTLPPRSIVTFVGSW